MFPTSRVRSLLVLAVPLVAIFASAGQSTAALQPRSLLDVAAAPTAHLRLRLHVGEYQIRASEDGHIHVFETQKEGSEAPGKTDVRFHQTATGGRLEIEPPMGKSSPHITIALPPCSALDLALSIGQLVFDAVPCEATSVSLHVGELRAALGAPQATAPQRHPCRSARSTPGDWARAMPTSSMAASSELLSIKEQGSVPSRRPWGAGRSHWTRGVSRTATRARDRTRDAIYAEKMLA